ncbi:sensor histidine kinase [Evtepia gabavorous]|uniref:sensor histidine kinase n=1 Tax=Evtepia gabavorous TaxID=2211183 RepID=UPI003A94AB6C
MKLFHRTFLFMLALFSIVVLVVHISIYLFLPKLYQENIRSDLDRQLEELSAVIGSIDQNACDNLLRNYAKRNQINIIARIDGEQKTFQGTAVQIIPIDVVDSEFQLENVKDVESFILRSRDVMSADSIPIHLQIGTSTQPGREAIRTTLALLPLTSSIAILFSVLFSWLYSKWLTRPIQNMLQVTEGMKNLDPDAYFQVDSQDEIGTLFLHLNQVYGQLWQTIDTLEKEKEHIFEIEKSKVDFLRSASHELKTPLAGLRILLENMHLGVGRYKDYSAYLPEAINTVDQLNGMVKEILNASRIQGEAERAAKDDLCISEELSAAIKEYEILARSKHLHIEVKMDVEPHLFMNRQHFQRVLSNLIGNAIHYTDAEGAIRIEGRTGELSVWNSCVPLTDEQLVRIFEPFYRPDFSRSAYSGGTGLGLYIIREILDANGLAYSFRPQDQGMCFSISLPGIPN